MLTHSSVCFTCQTEDGDTHVSHLVKNLPTFSTASNSVVLSAAAFIAWKYPCLENPCYPFVDLSSFLDLQNSSASHESSNLSIHPLYEAWCDILCDAIIKRSAVRHND